ncbi:PDCD5-related protein [Cryomyces antarcticus]
MSDADLEEIRRARLQQLQQQGGSSQGGQEGGQEDKQQRESEARSHILGQILTPEAADRLGRIRLVKESRATDVENRLIMLARSGQLRQKVTEEQLKDMLNALSEQARDAEKVRVVRRKGGWDDDDDLLDL